MIYVLPENPASPISPHKKRFSVIVRERADEFELCQCDSNPEQIVKAAARKYASVRFVDNHAQPDADQHQASSTSALSA